MDCNRHAQLSSQDRWVVLRKFTIVICLARGFKWAQVRWSDLIGDSFTNGSHRYSTPHSVQLTPNKRNNFGDHGERGYFRLSVSVTENILFGRWQWMVEPQDGDRAVKCPRHNQWWNQRWICNEYCYGLGPTTYYKVHCDGHRPVFKKHLWITDMMGLATILSSKLILHSNNLLWTYQIPHIWSPTSEKS